MALFPILDIPRSAGDQALIAYKLTTEEKKLFGEIDRATGELPLDAPTPRYHQIAAKIGATHGLDHKQSVAFFVRTTFGIFEPE